MDGVSQSALFQGSFGKEDLSQLVNRIARKWMRAAIQEWIKTSHDRKERMKEYLDSQTDRRTHLQDCHISVSMIIQNLRAPSSDSLTSRQFGDLGRQGSHLQIDARVI